MCTDDSNHTNTKYVKKIMTCTEEQCRKAVKMEREADIKKVCVKDAFWSDRQKLIADVVIPYQEKILNDEIDGAEKSHAFANFRIAAGLETGDFYGMVFQDSDVAKWLEGKTLVKKIYVPDKLVNLVIK